MTPGAKELLDRFSSTTLASLVDELIDALRWPRWFDTIEGNDFADAMRVELLRRRQPGEELG